MDGTTGQGPAPDQDNLVHRKRRRYRRPDRPRWRLVPEPAQREVTDEPAVLGWLPNPRSGGHDRCGQPVQASHRNNQHGAAQQAGGRAHHSLDGSSHQTAHGGDGRIRISLAQEPQRHMPLVGGQPPHARCLETFQAVDYGNGRLRRPGGDEEAHGRRTGTFSPLHAPGDAGAGRRAP